MKTIWLLLLLSVAMASAAPTVAPVQRVNAWITNAPGTLVRGTNDIGITNVPSLTSWLFYGTGPFTAARLLDVTNTANAAATTATGALALTMILSQGGAGNSNQFTNLFLMAGTNTIRFANSNLPPADTATIRKWISVTIQGETNSYRIGLFE